MQVSDSERIANSYPLSFFSFQATLTRFPFLDELQHSREPVTTQHNTQTTPKWPAHTWSVLTQAEWKCIMQRDTVVYISICKSILQSFSHYSSPKAAILGRIWQSGTLSKAYSCIWCNTCSICGKHYCYTHILILSDQHTACTLGEKVKSQIISLNTRRLRISHVGLRMAVKHSLKTKDGAKKRDGTYKEGVNSEGRGVDEGWTGGFTGASL